MKKSQKVYISLFVLLAGAAWFYYQQKNHERQLKLIQEVYERAKDEEKKGNFSKAHAEYSALCEGLESGIKREDLPSESCYKALELLCEIGAKQKDEGCDKALELYRQKNQKR